MSTPHKSMVQTNHGLDYECFSSVQFSHSVVSNSLRPHGMQPTRFLHPWDSPGKNPGVGCHFLLQGNNSTQKIKILFFKTSWNFFSNIFNLKLFESANVEPRDTYIQRATYINTHKHTHTQISVSSVAQSCLILCNPMNHSTPGFPVHHQLPEFTQNHVHRVRDAIQPSRPRSSRSPPAPNPSQHQSLFQ